mgnify:FL=1
MRFLYIVLMLLMTVSGYAQNTPIGNYNPEEDQTVYNNSGLERALVKFSEPIQEFFTKLNPEGYVDGPFTNFFTFVADILVLIALFFFYAKVVFRKKRLDADVNKLLYKYKLVLVILAVLMNLSMFKESFIWGVLLLLANVVAVSALYGLMCSRLCPHCCSYRKIDMRPQKLGIYSNEIYSLKTRDSQYLQAHEISESSLPYGGYELYHVEKVRYTGNCDKCGKECEYEKWERIKKL